MSYGMTSTGINPGSANTGSMKPFKEKLPSGYKAGALQQFTPEQMQLFQQMFSSVGPDSYLSKLAGGDQSLFGEIEAPALQQFASLQGNLGSRYSGMGGGGRQQSLGGRHSSGFQNIQNQAASDFAQQLQSNRQSLQRQAIQDLHSMSQDLLGQKPYERFLYEKPEKEGFNWGGIGGAALGGIGGFFAGGPAGALGGAQLGYGVGSNFSGHGGKSGGQGMDLSGFSNVFSGGSGFGDFFNSNKSPLTQGYNQELRMNPAAFGY